MTAPRIHTASQGALERVRRILVTLAVLSAAITAVTTVVAGTASPPLRAAGVLASAALAALWLRGYRRRGFGPAWDVPEAVALLAAMAAAPGIPPLPLFGLLYRGVYDGPWRSALRCVTWVAILSGTALLQDHFTPHDQIGKAAGLAVGVGLTHVLVKTLKRLSRAEARMVAVIRQSTDVVAIVAPDLQIRWAGRSLRGVGRTLPALVPDASFLDLLDPDDVPLAQHFAALAAAGEFDGAPFGVRMRDDDGECRDVEIVLSNQSHDEHIEGLLLTLRDVTERRRLERERAALEKQRETDQAAREALARLRERVEAEREREQLEARLQRSQRLVSVGQLAGGVAHDFNNLLAAILNYTVLLRDDLDPDAEAQEDLAEIEDAANRGARLVRQLLQFSKGETSSPDVLELNAVVDGLHGLLQHSLGRHVKLHYELDPDCWPVVADLTNAEQIVVNLVVNARDAIDDTGGTVTLATRDVELAADAAAALGIEPGPYVCLSVADDGCGMDDATVARALEPFFTTKEPGAGTGLGLATVAGIARQAGGWIAIDSRVGEGTTVRVHLPAHRVPAALPAA